MTSIGILPAAGKAHRFGGTLKELLPVSDGSSLMQRQVFYLKRYCHEIVIVTNADKIQAHAQHMKGFDNVSFVLQRDERDAWGAILAGLQFEADRYYYAYPDVYMDGFGFASGDILDFNLCLFETKQPERFGCYRYQKIYDKEPGKGIQKAYGALSWSREVRDFWLENDSIIKSHTHAFNLALTNFKVGLHEIDEYHDIASWDDYKRLVQDVL